MTISPPTAEPSPLHLPVFLEVTNLSALVSFSLSACGLGYFKSKQGENLCSPCPPNSRTTSEAATLCACRSNYFRADTDPPNSTCTSKLALLSSFFPVFQTNICYTLPISQGGPWIQNKSNPLGNRNRNHKCQQMERKALKIKLQICSKDLQIFVTSQALAS